MDVDSRRPNTTIYVSNLDPVLATQQTLSEVFIPFGEITSISLPAPTQPSSTDLHRGFGYVEFEEANDAKEAINNMDQSELFGRVIKVAVAKPERRDDVEGKAGLGSTVAVWEKEGYQEKYGDDAGREGDDQDEKVDGVAGEDPMQGLEGLDVAGPRAA